MNLTHLFKKEKDRSKLHLLRYDLITDNFYDLQNRPIGKIQAIECDNGDVYKIFVDNTSPLDSWTDKKVFDGILYGKFHGDYYTVYKYIKFEKSQGFWQPVTNAYLKYSTALDRLKTSVADKVVVKVWYN